ncbi:TetR/AcrR family transcriptional regulator [Calditrichota bacterium]
MTPQTKNKFDEMRAQSIEKITQAALELFTDVGYHKTTISMIAAKAGISTGLMYNYYKTKEELLEVLASNNFRKAREGMRMLKDADGAEVVSAIIKGLNGLSDHERARNSKLALFLLTQPDVPDSVAKIAREFTAESYDFQEGLFAKMGAENPKLNALLLSAIIGGVRLQYFMFGDKYPLKEMVELIADNHLFKPK